MSGSSRCSGKNVMSAESEPRQPRSRGGALTAILTRICECPWPARGPWRQGSTISTGTERPGGCIAEIARRHEISRGLLWNWRRKVRRVPAGTTAGIPASADDQRSNKRQRHEACRGEKLRRQRLATAHLTVDLRQAHHGGARRPAQSGAAAIATRKPACCCSICIRHRRRRKASSIGATTAPHQTHAYDRRYPAPRPRHRELCRRRPGSKSPRRITVGGC